MKDIYVDLYKFYVGGDPNIPEDQRVILLGQWMNSLHPDEAKFMFDVFEQTVYREYRISKTIIDEVFPTIKWGHRGPGTKENKEVQDEEKRLKEAMKMNISHGQSKIIT